MTLPVTLPTVGQTYDRIRAALATLKARLPGFIAQYGATVSINALTDSLIPYLRDLSATCPPSAAFPQAWVDGLEAYAQAQMPGAMVSWVDAYDLTGTAIRAALAAALDVLPRDGDGYVLAWQFDSAGAETVRTLPAVDVASVKAALESLSATVA